MAHDQEAARAVRGHRVLPVDAHGLLGLGAMALDLGAMTAFLYTFTEREKLYNLFELLTGARFTTSYTRVGGQIRGRVHFHDGGPHDTCGRWFVGDASADTEVGAEFAIDAVRRHCKGLDLEMGERGFDHPPSSSF